MPTAAPPTVRRLHSVNDTELAALAALLVDCVEGGASVGYLHPLPLVKALAFWRQVAESVALGKRVLLVAEDERGLLGTVQLVLDQPDNQPHRADLSKMLVLRRARKCGLGAALMRAAEEVARASGKTLLVLDTANADAGRLYAGLGWQRCGVVPGYALLPDGTACDTTYFYRALTRQAGPSAPMSPAPVAGPHSALIIIDMQKCMAADTLPARNNPQAETQMLRLRDAWRRAGQAVVSIRHISRASGSGFAPGQAGAEFQARFAPLDDEHVVEKNVPDAFVNTGLERWLRARAIRRLVLVGVSTNNSVEASARSAGNLGFATVVVSDATFAFERRDFGGTLRGADAVHLMSLANLEGDYATVSSTQEVLDNLANGAD